MPLGQQEWQFSQLPPFARIQPTLPPTHAQPVSNKPVSTSPLSQTQTKQLKPTQILAPLQPVSLPQISTLPEEDELEPDQQEPEPERLLNKRSSICTTKTEPLITGKLCHILEVLCFRIFSFPAINKLLNIYKSYVQK